MAACTVRPMTDADAESVIDIYRAGLETGQATFESSVPDWPAWSSAHVDHSRLVALQDSEVVGWAALAPVSKRHVYRGVAEVSVYVAPRSAGAGIGSRLLAALIESAEANGVWMLQAVIFEENKASVKLHTRHGFRLVGRRERIGLMQHGPQAGRWRDTLLMERRSAAPNSS